MEAPVAALAEVEQQLAGVLAAIVPAGVLRTCSDDDLVAFATVLGGLKRRVEGALIEAAGHVAERATGADPDTSIVLSRGCRNVNELLQRATGDSSRTAGEVLRAAKLVHADTDLYGVERPPKFPALREALLSGRIGVDGVLAAGRPLDAVRARVGLDVIEAAERVIADQLAADPALAPADTLRHLSVAVAERLDADGPEPTVEEIAVKRSFWVGRADDGLVPVRGHLLPEVAAVLRRGMASVLSPRTPKFTDDGDPIPVRADVRTPGAKQHDALATLLNVAVSAGSRDVPDVNGAAPTLVVMVDEKDLRSGTGQAFVPDADSDGTTVPVHVNVATHTACTGGILRVVEKDGRIVGLSTQGRCFTGPQRQAIAARDVTCVIPGCTVPAVWCEFHHVTPFREGGATHVDNGVLLCWHHHRTIDSSGWLIQMRNGVPWVAPPLWIDPIQEFRQHRPPPAVRRRV